MKTLFITSAITLLNIKVNFLPSTALLIALATVMLIDFGTGILKAVINKEARTSQSYRKTMMKFLQYGGGVCVGLCIKFLALQTSVNIGDAIKYIDLFNDGLVLFIIFIELTSILENLYAVDQTSVFAQYFIKPILRLLTFELKNNPFIKAAEKMDNKV